MTKIDPDFTDHYKDPSETVEELEEFRKKLRELQELLYAERRRSVLICLQAMDTGGKDGTINHILGAMNPQGCRVVGFKQPSQEELSHDFLWRIHKATPGRGEVVIFNRSHYEDVLIARVHNIVPKKVWKARYDQINAFEEILCSTETHILKFYLHISKEEQFIRLGNRLANPQKHWKVSDGDYKERESWHEYQLAYQDALSFCSTKRSPWFIIPANQKWFRNLAVAKIVVEYLEDLNMKCPKPSVNIEKLRAEFGPDKPKKSSLR